MVQLDLPEMASSTARARARPAHKRGSGGLALAVVDSSDRSCRGGSLTGLTCFFFWGCEQVFGAGHAIVRSRQETINHLVGAAPVEPRAEHVCVE